MMKFKKIDYDVTTCYEIKYLHGNLIMKEIQNNSLGEKIMENGSQISTDSLLLARGVGGVGGGYGFGGFGGYNGGMGVGSTYANPTANAVRIDAAGERSVGETRCLGAGMGAGLDRISDQAEEGRRSAQFTTIVDNMNSNSMRLSDSMSATNLNAAINDGNTRVENVRTLADIRAEIAACCCETQKELLKQQLENQKCCCETQKLVSAEGTATRELINARALDDAHRALDASVSRNNSCETISALVGAMQNQTATLIATLGNNHHHG